MRSKKLSILIWFFFAECLHTLAQIEILGGNKSGREKESLRKHLGDG